MENKKMAAEIKLTESMVKELIQSHFEGRGMNVKKVGISVKKVTAGSQINEYETAVFENATVHIEI